MPTVSSGTLVRASSGALVTGAGATLEIPLGALETDATATVTRVATPPASAPTGRILLKSAFDFSTGSARLRQNAILHIPTDQDMKPGDSAIIAWFDQGQWRPVPAVAESQHMLRASVPHLSIWGVPSLDLRQIILAALGLRASLSCEAPHGTLVDLFLTQDGGLIVPPGEGSGETPLIVCPKDRADGTVDLAVANNRSYALRVRPLNLVVEPRSLLDEGPVEAAVGSFYRNWSGLRRGLLILASDR